MPDLNLVLPVPAELNPSNQRIRIAGTWERPFFCLPDLCAVIGIGNPRAVAARVPDDEKITVTQSDGNRGNPNVTYVSESWFYRIVLRSDKPTAEPFADWVTKDVLPCIRQFGQYPAPTGHFVHPLTPRPWAERFRATFGEHTRYVKRNFLAGSFTAVTAALNEYHTLEDHLLAHAMTVQDSDRPDVSVGRRWSDFVRDHGWDGRRVGRAPLYLPNQKFEVMTFVYGPDLRGNFEYWLNNIYLPQHLHCYLRDKKELKPFGPLPVASVANRTCLELTGEPAALSQRLHRELESRGGFVPALRPGESPPQIEG